MKKVLYLFLAFAVPGLIFVFLKYGASNRFEIPVYPMADKPLHSDCTGEVSGPYAVPDSTWQYIQKRGVAGHVVIFTDSALNAPRIEQEITEELGDVVSFTMGEKFATDPLVQSRWRSCVFLLGNPQHCVLLDSLGQIRGQYNLHGRDEIDRLRVEIKILASAN